MRLRRIALGGVVLGVLGVVVRAEGRAVGRVLLGVGDTRVSGAAVMTAGREGAEPAVRLTAGAPGQPVTGPGEGVRI